MGCCGDSGSAEAAGGRPSSDLDGAVETRGGAFHLDLSVPDISCAACIGRIEGALAKLPGLERARVNFGARRVALDWTDPAFDPADALALLADLGYPARPWRASGEAADDDPKGRALLRATAVSGFAAMNVMLLSVSVWAGADGATKDFLHWFAALIALPAVVYAGRPFFRSAIAGLSRGQLNMDVPISLGVVLASGLSLYETAFGTADTYFEAAITLLFFLLVGRTLDHFTRERARGAVAALARLAPRTARRVAGEGLETVAIDEILPGDTVEVAAGERVPADGTLLADRALAFDRSLVSGEGDPVPVRPGETVLAGTLALDGPVRLSVLRPAEESFLADMRRMMAAAEDVRSAPMRIAERAARLYAPVVHIVAILACLGWLAAGASFYTALSIAIVVLIITCPCALALAVPAVQVVASERLFRSGVALKDGLALERMRAVTHVVFDKTGTLTIPRVADPEAVGDEALAAAAALARHSSHPAARAVVAAAAERGLALPATRGAREERGNGVEGIVAGRAMRLGRAAWASGAAADGEGASGLVIAADGARPVPIRLAERLRPGAAETVAALRRDGLSVSILSGDRAGAVAAVAAALDVADWRAGVAPADKLAALEARAADGERVLMVGDGINDGPALAAAHASMSPAEGADLSRTAADMVLMGERLDGAWIAWRTARAAHRHVVQNFAIALLYNVVAIPLACAGLVTPLIAALAMSSSSILVTLNALRLRLAVPAAAPAARPAAPGEGAGASAPPTGVPERAATA